MTTLAEVTITVQDVRRTHCIFGARQWFRAHDLDFRDFVRHGVSAQVMWGTGDELGRQVVRRKLDDLGLADILEVLDGQ